VGRRATNIEGVGARRILKEEFEIDCSLSSTYRLLHRIKLSWLAPRPSPPAGRRNGASGVFATLGLQLERVRPAQARGRRVEAWFQDEARIDQENSLARVWEQTGSRPVAPKDLGFASAYVFGVVCPSICNTVAVNHDPRVKPWDQQSSRRPPLSRGQALPMPW